MRSSWLVVVLVVGCYHDVDPPPATPIANVSPPVAPAPPPAREHARLPPPSEIATDVPAGFPASCREYGAAIEQLAACDKLPQASKDALKESLKTMVDSWKDFATMPAEAIKAMEDACAEARDAVLQAAAVCK